MLYDGVCRFCNGAVQWALRNDRKGVIHFAPLQSAFAAQLVQKHPELRSVDSVILLEPDGRLRLRSDAVLRIAGIVGGWWRVLQLGHVFPRFVRDWLYDRFAARRYRWFGRYDSCMRPSPEMMSRFVDTA